VRVKEADNAGKRVWIVEGQTILFTSKEHALNYSEAIRRRSHGTEREQEMER
jgi:hypothetical protein